MNGSILRRFPAWGDKAKDKSAGLLVALVAFFVYANSLANGFVWDDTNVILANPVLLGSPVALFSTIDVTRDNELTPYYRPLTLLTFLFEERLHGFNPFFMHLVNVLLHAANAFLVFRLARAFLGRRHSAVLAGLLFAVHPINTESVDLISARNTLLSSLCILSAYLLHRRSVLRNNMAGALAGGAVFFAGLLSKEMTLLIAPFIAALEIPSWRENAPASRRMTAVRLLPYVAAAACYLVMRWLTLSKLGIQTGIIPGFGTKSIESMYFIPDLGTRLLNNVYIMPKYMLTLIWPTGLSPRYALPEDLSPYKVPLAAAWTCILGLLAWMLNRGRSRTTLFGLAWLGAFWLPVSGIFWLASAPLADRFLYLPLLGLWLIVADRAAFLFSSTHAKRAGAAAAVAVLVLLALGVLTVRRNLDWKSDVSLFSRFVEQYPDNAYAHAGLGEAYFNRDREDDVQRTLAERELIKALELNPLLPGVHTKLGYIRLARADSERAVFYFTKALAIYPFDKEARLDRAIALENLGRQKEALEDFRVFLATPGYEFADARPYAEFRVRELTRTGRL